MPNKSDQLQEIEEKLHTYKQKIDELAELQEHLHQKIMESYKLQSLDEAKQTLNKLLD